MNYKILINKNAVPVLIEASNNADPDTWFSLDDESRHIQFKDEKYVLDILPNRRFENRAGDTFPIPDNISVGILEECGRCSDKGVRVKLDCRSIFCEKKSVAFLSKLDVEPVVAPSEEVKQNWISVKDRLPEKEDRYLTYQDDGCYVMSYYNNEIDGSNWLMDGFTHFPTHWMPLPKKPF